ncbi:MAG: hypothetical protein EZS28_011510 [Streblomastix strix]|uniref:Uncharacterized protein n=1 Tax=Streblomastix strix TaxID=222440 RepID=A0A5J4WE59_9EUKA|nr:MAG: hypothetical protein EZS28_011510 [Streblomastix strix]
MQNSYWNVIQNSKLSRERDQWIRTEVNDEETSICKKEEEEKGTYLQVGYHIEIYLRQRFIELMQPGMKMTFGNWIQKFGREMCIDQGASQQEVDRSSQHKEEAGTVAVNYDMNLNDKLRERLTNFE